MSRLTLGVSFPLGFTMVPNSFMDQQMPRANGEFVKIYLELLRLAESGETEIALSTIADRLFCTEADVRRGLSYWEKEKLIRLEKRGGEITGMTLLSGGEWEAKPARQATGSASSEEAEDRISTERALELREKEDIRELLFIAEQYLEKPLTPTEMQKILYLYDEYHFTTDLIDYLIEYCVLKNHKSIYYIMKVGRNWHDEGINTVRAARASVNRYNKDYYEILKAFGISNRNPLDAEIDYMKRWIETYGFSLSLIEEACKRTVMNTGKPSFQYADGILKTWAQKKITSLKDVEREDREHAKRAQSASDKKAPAKKNAFGNFSQRQYDYDELEKQYLNQKK